MSALTRIALVGFTAFETENFDAYFRLADPEHPHFVLTPLLSDCRLAVVNADDEAAVAEVTRQDKLQCSLVLGQRLREGAAMQLGRPINLSLVVRALEELAAQEPPASRAVRRVLDDLADVTATMASHIRPRELVAAWAGGASNLRPSTPARQLPERAHATPVKPGRRGALDHILVVDSRDATMRFIVTQLERFGFQVHLARRADEALDHMATRHFELVFVDVDLADARGRNTCEAITRLAARRKDHAPTVVVVADEHTPLADLPDAGCDAYLLRPLSPEALLKVVGDHEVTRHAFARTAHTARSLI